MMKRPFVFFTQDYGQYLSNGNGTDLSGAFSRISVQNLPYEVTVFFTDKWGNVVNRRIDTLMLSCANVANMTVAAADSAGNYTAAWTVSGNTESDFILKLAAPLTTSSVRLIIPEEGNPQTVNIAKIGICGYLCDLLALTDAAFKKDSNQGQYRTISGDMVFYGDYDKLDTKLKAESLPKSQFDLLTAQVDETNRLTVLPFYDEEPGKICACYVSPEYSFELDRKTGLYSLTLELKEL